MDERTDVVKTICYFEEDGERKYLLLEREMENGYSLREFPGGGLEDERAFVGALRELYEEVREDNQAPDNLSEISEINALPHYVFESEDQDYVIYPFELELEEDLDVSISDEHVDYEFADRERVEELREDGIFKDSRAINLLYLEKLDESQKQMTEEPEFRTSPDDIEQAGAEAVLERALYPDDSESDSASISGRGDTVVEAWERFMGKGSEDGSSV